MEVSGADFVARQIRTWVLAGNPHATLYLNKCGLNKLPLLPRDLLWLNCDDNLLTSLDGPQLPLCLHSLSCNGNRLTSEGLEGLPDSLYALYCERNAITSLPRLPTGLDTLQCRYNLIVRLSSTPLPAKLRTLYCGNRHLMDLGPYPLPCSLEHFGCFGSSLRSLGALAMLHNLVTLGLGDNAGPLYLPDTWPPGLTHVNLNNLETDWRERWVRNVRKTHAQLRAQCFLKLSRSRALAQPTLRQGAILLYV